MKPCNLLPAVLLLLLGTCMCGCTWVRGPGEPGGNQNTGPGDRTPVAGLSSAESPAMLITSPAFDGGIAAGNVSIVVNVEHSPAEADIVYYRDMVPPVAPGRPACPGAEPCAISSLPSYTWEGVMPGTHTFAVQLVNPDGTPLDPPVLDAVDVTAVSPSDIVVP